jgi:hypothetical protein
MVVVTAISCSMALHVRALTLALSSLALEVVDTMVFDSFLMMACTSDIASKVAAAYTLQRTFFQLLRYAQLLLTPLILIRNVRENMHWKALTELHTLMQKKWLDLTFGGC